MYWNNIFVHIIIVIYFIHIYNKINFANVYITTPCTFIASIKRKQQKICTWTHQMQESHTPGAKFQTHAPAEGGYVRHTHRCCVLGVFTATEQQHDDNTAKWACIMTLGVYVLRQLTRLRANSCFTRGSILEEIC